MPGTAQARVRGVPTIPTITEINVRPGPSTDGDPAFKAPVGMDALTVLEVQPDAQSNDLNGKIYQWFKLEFHGGAVGWIRDDLLEVMGDLTPFGYSDLSEYTFAHPLVRQSSKATTTEQVEAEQAETPGTPPPATGDFPLAPDDYDRVRDASFALTAAFEGGGYASFNNYDAGIISYGILQFTLAAGSLGTVCRRYVELSDSENSQKLEGYLQRIIARDPSLRSDTQLRDILIAAADEEPMRRAQDETVEAGYWKRVVDGYIAGRALKLPTTWALLFDMGVNFGVNHGFVRLAERNLGVPGRSKPGENGITEEQLMTEVARLRKQSHDRQAERDNLPGLKVRGDFWWGLVTNGDWYLRGDANGNYSFNGKTINVLNG